MRLFESTLWTLQFALEGEQQTWFIRFLVCWFLRQRCVVTVGTHTVDHANLELTRRFYCPCFQSVGSKVCTTLSGSFSSLEQGFTLHPWLFWNRTLPPHRQGTGLQFTEIRLPFPNIFKLSVSGNLPLVQHVLEYIYLSGHTAPASVGVTVTSRWLR